MNKNTKRLAVLVIGVLALVILIGFGISSCTGDNDNLPVNPDPNTEMTDSPAQVETEAAGGANESMSAAVGEDAAQPTEEEDETTPTQKDDATEPTEKETEPVDESNLTEYEKYLKMSAEEQTAYFNSFESVEAFITWYNNAKAEYEALHPGIDVGDGSIDFGSIAP